MKIENFFSLEWVRQTFPTWQAARDFAIENECEANVQAWWQTEDGEIFTSEETANIYARNCDAAHVDYDAISLRGVEMFGLFPS